MFAQQCEEQRESGARTQGVSVPVDPADKIPAWLPGSQLVLVFIRGATVDNSCVFIKWLFLMTYSGTSAGARKI